MPRQTKPKTHQLSPKPRQILFVYTEIRRSEPLTLLYHRKRRITLVYFISMRELKLVLIISSIVLLSGCSSAKKDSLEPTPTTNPQVQTEEKADYQASFEIYTDGLKRNFTSPKYHNQSPDVFITSDNPSIVNIKKKGITWDDFFKTLPMKLTKDCLTTGDGEVLCNSQTKTLKFYINDVENPDFLNEKIKSGDKARVSWDKI